VSLIDRLFGRSACIEFLDSPENVVDVHSFRARERLKVHEARNDSELHSRVERHGQRVPLNLQHMRHRRRSVMGAWQGQKGPRRVRRSA